MTLVKVSGRLAKLKTPAEIVARSGINFSSYNTRKLPTRINCFNFFQPILIKCLLLEVLNHCTIQQVLSHQNNY